MAQLQNADGVSRTCRRERNVSATVERRPSDPVDTSGNAVAAERLPSEVERELSRLMPLTMGAHGGVSRALQDQLAPVRGVS